MEGKEHEGGEKEGTRNEGKTQDTRGGIHLQRMNSKCALSLSHQGENCI